MANIPDKNPAARAPTELEEDRPKVDAGDGKYSETTDLKIGSKVSHLRGKICDWYHKELVGVTNRSITRWLDTSIDTDNIHDDCLGRAGPQEAPPPAKGVGNKDEEQETTNDLNDSVDTRSKKRDQVAF